MLKLFILFLFTLTLLQANSSDERCLTDMKEMFQNYYDAGKKHSIELYQKSIYAAQSAIEECSGQDNYDFDIMYEFIQESQKKIDLYTLKQSEP